MKGDVKVFRREQPDTQVGVPGAARGLTRSVQT